MKKIILLLPVIGCLLAKAQRLHKIDFQSFTSRQDGPNKILLPSCWDDVIRIFPAIPASWKEVSIDKLLAKNAFEVSAVRKNGQTQFIKIKTRLERKSNGQQNVCHFKERE